MFQHQGIWLPDGEKHFPVWMDKHGEISDGRGTYQIEKWRACLPRIKLWRTAVDVGAHVGFWSIQMVRYFEQVDAFEPVPDFRACYVRNVVFRPEDRLYENALGSRPGKVAMVVPPLEDGVDTGGTHVNSVAESGDIELCTLDSFKLENVDFIKIDCEGYEHHVVLGAAETLKRCKPCIIVEQKPHKLGPNFGIKGTPAVDLLKALGAKVRVVMSGDYIMSWD